MADPKTTEDGAEDAELNALCDARVGQPIIPVALDDLPGMGGSQKTDPLRDALRWVSEIQPTPTTDGAAMVLVTWKEWNNLRRALGLPEQKPTGRNKRV